MKTKFSSSFTPLLVFAMVASSSALGQTQVKALTGLTPNQLHDGSAKVTGHYDPTKNLRLVIGLQHPHMAEEEQFLKELGTKGSPNFQKFLTADQWNKRFGPSVADEQAVVDWATSQGLTVSRRFPNRLLVDIDAPSAAIEKAFGVTINSYQVATRAAFSNDRDPVIPAALSNIIHSIGGLNNIQVLRPHSKNIAEPAFADYSPGPAFATAAAGSASATAKRPKKASGVKPNITNGAYDPTDIYSSQAYDVNALYAQGHCCNPLGNSGGTPPQSSIAIATAGTQAGSDLAGFQAAYSYLAYNYQQIYVDGTPTCCDGEGTLDFDWSIAWSNSFGSYLDTAKVYLYDGVNNQFSTFTDVYNQILTDQNAKIFSTSWGCEELSCTPQSVMDTDHGIFNSMIGQGMTLVAASGDQGATAGCGNAVAVQYPASDPNVVGAGGTTLLLDGNSNYISETAWTGGPDGCGSNDGGSTGGYSAYYAQPSYQNGISGLGSQRYVPDIALNADWYNSPQNYFFGGSLSGNGGTSIVAPSIAGFFAQTNAYLDYVGTLAGGCFGNGTTCSSIGNGNWYLYWFGENPSYAPHYPFYDITSGCNNNDITAEYGLGYFCAAPGYDPVTGWGSFNALQLTRAITTYRAYYGTTTASFSGYTQPTINQWYNTDQQVQWTISGTGNLGYPFTGVAGFTADWDTVITDSTSEATPGSGDSFYSGPQNPNATTGSLDLASAGQGCHTAQILSWDNSGGSGYQTYGPVCYDTVAPVTTASLSGTTSSGVYTSAVKVTLAATDANSGVKSTVYSLDGGSYVAYSAPFTVPVTAQGTHILNYYSTDAAGNVESTNTLVFSIESPTATTLTSTAASLYYGQSVTFKATVTPSFGSAVSGTVAFKDAGTLIANVTVSGGAASLTLSTLHAGSHSITAVYSGSAYDLTSTSAAVSLTVKQSSTTTAVVSSLNPSVWNQSVTYTATVASEYGGPVNGTITFKNGQTVIGTATLNPGNNKASVSTSALTGGTHNITAVFGGTGDQSASSSAVLTQTVNKATSTMAINTSLNPSNYNHALTFTVVIVSQYHGAITGSINLRDGTTSLGNATLVNGQVSFTVDTLVVGTHSITAVYAGDYNNQTNTSSAISEKINTEPTQLSLFTSINSINYGQSPALSAFVNPSNYGTVTGTVTFKNGQAILGYVNLSSNEAMLITNAFNVGSHTITASYAGNSNVQGSNSNALTITVAKSNSSTTLISSQNPSTLNQSVTFTATPNGTYGGLVAGTVTFKDGTTTLGSATVSSTTGTATYSTSALAHGTHSITAVYAGSSNLNGSTSSVLTQTVN